MSQQINMTEAAHHLALTSDCAAAGNIEVTEASEEDTSSWNCFVTQNSEGDHYHAWPWGDIISSSFGHRGRRLIARRGSCVVGVLPLSEVRSLIVGRVLISLPYLNGGGLLVADAAAAQALLSHCAKLQHESSARYVELRHRGTGSQALSGWCSSSHKVAMSLSLDGDSDALFHQFPGKLRSQIRRPIKAGAIVESYTGENYPKRSIDGFYQVFSTNMHALGTPVYPKQLFMNTLKAFGPHSRLITVWLGARCAAGAITIAGRDSVEIPWASSLREDNHVAPNMLLYWEAIRNACQDGYQSFDFGRSTPGSGTYRFKCQWGANPKPLYWHYSLAGSASIPDLNPNSQKYRIVTNIWRRLPLPMTKLAGPWLTRSLP